MATTTVTGTWLKPNGDPASGRVTFRLVAATYHDGLDAIFPQTPVTAVLDADGAISIELEPTSGVDADFDATDMTYEVVERITGAQRDPYYVDIPTAAGVDLGTLVTYEEPQHVTRVLVDVDAAALGIPALIADHAAAADPHTGYLTEVAANATYARQDRRALNLLDLIGGSVSGSNDTAAVNAALAAFDAAGGGTLRIPAADWTFTGSTGLALATSNPIHLVADPGATFDMTGSTATVGLTLGGSLGSSAALGADVTAVGALTITCGLAVSPGDLIRIESTAYWVTTSVKGELAEVLSESGGVITLKSRLWDTYTAATTTVHKVNAPRVTVQGLRILRNSNHEGLRVSYARDVLLKDLYLEGARERLIRVAQVFGAHIENCRGRDFWYSGTGTSYGLSIDSSQHVVEVGNDFRGGRHGIAHGGAEFPSRDIQMIGGVYDSYHPSSQASVDFHENCENVRMIGVTCLNGLISEASNFDANGCTVRTSTTTPLNVNLEPNRSCNYVRFRNGDVITSNANAAVQLMSRVGATAVVVKEVEISGHLVNTAEYAVRIGPATTADIGLTVDRIIIAGNLLGTGAIAHTRAAPAEVSTGVIEVSGRAVATTSAAIVVTSTGNGVLKMTNLDLTGVAGQYVYNATTTGSMDVVIRDSRIRTGYNNRFSTGRVEIQDTTLESLSNSGGIDAASASEVLFANVRSISCTGTPTLPARNYSLVNAAGKVTTHGTAAPAAGTWAVGDICWNTATAAAGVPGWVCTTAGTPGTWKAMAAVAA